VPPGQRCKGQGSRLLNSITRFAKQGASNIKFAPKLYSQCLTDVQTFCKDVQPGDGQVHACLLKNKDKLSSDCARAEFGQQLVQSTDIRAHPKAMAACRESIKKLCPDVQMGSGRVWACLQDAKGSPDMAEACAAIVKNHTRLQHSEYHLNPSMSNFCEQDAKKLCGPQLAKADRKDFKTDGAVITCLIQSMESVTNPACKASLRTKAGQRVQDVQNDPEAYRVCANDVKIYCVDARAGGPASVKKCLQAHLQSLSEACRDKQKFYMAMASTDIRLNNNLLKGCATAEKRFCSEVNRGEGRVIFCLLDHMHHPDMEATCREHLTEEMEKRTKSLSFNPALKKNCEKDIQALKSKNKCPILHSPGGGINCLTTNLDIVTEPECKKSITDLLRLQSADVRAKPGMQQACATDIAALCKGVAPGGAKLHKCLRNHQKEIKDSKCKAMVQEVEDNDKRSFKINFNVRTHCKNERETFCKDAVVGRAQVMTCLALHRNETGFGQECAHALSDSQIKTPLMKQQIAAQLENLQGWLLSHRGIIEEWGGVMLGCVVALVAAAAFGISYWILQQRFKKVGYSVTVAPSAMD